MPTAPVPTKIRGYEGQLYYTPSGGAETLWVNITDIDIDTKADDIDASDHATAGWKDRLTGLKEWTGTFKATAIQSGADLQAIYSAFSTGANVGFSFRPQDVTGGLAYTGTAVVSSFKHGAPNSGVQTLDVSVSGRGALVLGTVATAGV